MKREPIVTLEVGTHKVRTLIGRIDEEGILTLLGVGEVLSQGVEKAAIVDPRAARTCVDASMKEAENMTSGVMADQVHVLFSCGEVLSEIKRARVPIHSRDRTINDSHVADVQQTARAYTLPVERKLLHAIPQNYYVDDQPEVVDPRDMYGSKLELDMLLIHAVYSPFLTIGKVVEDSRAEVLSYAFAGLCVGLAVATPEQRERGALVIDLGAGTTDYVFYVNGITAYAGSLLVGGNHVTRDIAAGLKLGFRQAEMAKIQHASCMMTHFGTEGRMLRVSATERDDETTVNGADLNLITHARMEEILLLIQRQLKQQGLLHRLQSGVIFTGGGAAMRDLIPLGNRVFKCPCRVGEPFGVEGLPADHAPAGFAAPIGLMRYINDTRGEDRPRSFFANLFKRN